MRFVARADVPAGGPRGILAVNMGVRREIMVGGRSRFIACFVLFLASALAYSQEEVDPAAPTLRVYTNLLQIPTLVLDSRHQPIKGIAENRFRVSIDSGPKNRVTHVRAEGEDPIALAILVDTARLSGSMRSRLQSAITGLVPNSLHSGDSVSLYSLDCQLSRGAVAKPTSAATLSPTAALLFGGSKGADKSRGKESCAQHWNLVDSIVAAVQGLKDESGRRVLLVLTDGIDRGSRTAWDAARNYASDQGVAIFGIVPSTDVSMPIMGRRGVVGMETESAVTNMPALCDPTGGFVLDNTNASLASQMRDFVALVRNRYIIEFPKPNADAGRHRMEISVEKLSGAMIRAAGASVPVADLELAKDPNTIISGPENAPEVGTKRPTQ